VNAGPDYWYPEPHVTRHGVPGTPLEGRKHSRKVLVFILLGFLTAIAGEFAELIRISGRN
jgi:hypothetical protein